ncbi:rod shape-determining protein MreC [Pontibacterium granulatum]|uniref:rod shape-determining protein MreC n=1 Tax=Pontibacterium granulatum TaxID=2036029 RepID=UPI00249C151F|nr:rod shape-determining protein MreC [Pontibacterium granulatum]MDI3323190.1 rod shape-determining protein MreC [Pontibacterium granulatum]
MIVLLLSFILIAADVTWNGMRQGRAYIALILTPVQWLVDLPAEVADEVSDVVVDRGLLMKENARLKADALLLEQKGQQLASLTEENKRLRALLSGRQRIPDEVTLVELIGVNPDPFQHQVIIDQGSEDGIYLGQPVLDAGGVMGQVVEMSHYTSRVMLITDTRHAIPVELNRTGFRAIALGKGEPDELELQHVSDTTDIQVGDLLVTSGLGGRFPRGYPVAVVTEVIHDPGQTFSKVRAKPSARLDKSRHLLLVDRAEPIEPADLDASADPIITESGE